MSYRMFDLPYFPQDEHNMSYYYSRLLEKKLEPLEKIMEKAYSEGHDEYGDAIKEAIQWAERMQIQYQSLITDWNDLVSRIEDSW